MTSKEVFPIPFVTGIGVVHRDIKFGPQVGPGSWQAPISESFPCMRFVALFVAHRLENFLFEKPESDFLKLIDFGPETLHPSSGGGHAL